MKINKKDIKIKKLYSDGTYTKYKCSTVIGGKEYSCLHFVNEYINDGIDYNEIIRNLKKEIQ